LATVTFKIVGYSLDDVGLFNGQTESGLGSIALIVSKDDGNGVGTGSLRFAGDKTVVIAAATLKSVGTGGKVKIGGKTEKLHGEIVLGVIVVTADSGFVERVELAVRQAGSGDDGSLVGRR
jgi:hypothetical protein